MPYKDKHKQREYLKNYKLKNQDVLIEKRRVQYHNTHIVPDFWSAGHSDNAICLSCGRKTSRKPKQLCAEKKHMQYYLARKARNNERRKEKRKINPYYGSGYTKEEWAENSRLKYRQLKYETISRLGGKCSICGYKDFRALEIDHIIPGSGRTDRIKHGWSYWKMLNKMDLVDLLDRFQCLCSNCHSIKSYNEKYKPIITEKVTKKEKKRL